MVTRLRTPAIETLTYPDGSTNPVRVFAGTLGRPVIMVWPGQGVPAAYYDLIASYLVDRGYNAVVSEQRGHGSARPKIGPTSRFSYNDVASVDYPAVAEAAGRLFPASKRVLLGHSMGGLIGAMYAARARRNLAGLVLIASGPNHFRLESPPTGASRLVAMAFVAHASRVRGYWSGEWDGFGPQARGMARDFAHLVRTGSFNVPSADMDYEARIGQTKTPVLAVAITGDRAVSVAQTRAVAAKFPHENVSYATIPEALGHNHWALKPERSMPPVMDWLGARFPTD